MYEPGVPCWVETLQPDPEAAMAFYGGIFGWEFEGPGRMPGSRSLISVLSSSGCAVGADYGDRCGVARALDVVGERRALLVVRELLLGPKGFTDLRAGFPT